MSTIARVPIEELAISVVPEPLHVLLHTDRAMLDDFSYWSLVDAILTNQAPGIRPLGAPYKVIYDYISTPEEVDAIAISHDCDGCRTGIRKARAHLEDNPGTMLCVMQCTQDYLQEVPDGVTVTVAVSPN